MKYKILILLGALCLSSATLHAGNLDGLRVVPYGSSPAVQKAAKWFQEELNGRSGLQPETAPITIRHPGPRVIFSIGNHPSFPGGKVEAAPPESYEIRTLQHGLHESTVILIAGRDARGLFYGTGRLLRELRLSPNSIHLSKPLQELSSPKFPIRGHQLGYRPKTNSYDAWDVDRWEQYYRDLLVFGINAVELIPPGTDDASTSPHFKRPPMEMLSEMSRLAKEYELDVWLWLPAMARDYSKPETVERSLKEWEEIFRKTPRLDALFVPGGDPGGTPPAMLFDLLAKQSENLKKFHPEAEIWVSPQGFRREEFDEFVALVSKRNTPWLKGIVYGPQVRVSMEKLRELIPHLPIRHYPDITHSWRCEYPVPDWDGAWSLTSGREPINPRPVDQKIIFDSSVPHGAGFITYSEGCNDDVNKSLWSAWGWDNSQSAEKILHHYARYFAGSEWEELVVEVINGLEKNWRGPVLQNKSIANTLKRAQMLEKHPAIKTNWRLQQLLYRAYYDAYVAERLRRETHQQERAMAILKKASSLGAIDAMKDAESLLGEGVPNGPHLKWKERATQIADDLFASIGMQLSVSRHKAIGLERGATLDGIDEPLNDRRWLKQQFGRIRSLPSEEDRLREIQSILDWEKPGPGGFYDDLGNPQKQPHLVREVAYLLDPNFLHSPMTSFGNRGSRMSWWNHAETLYDQPMAMKYSGLRQNQKYQVKITYAGDMTRRKVRLEADGVEIHPYQTKFFNAPVEYALPREVTADGTLTLRWNLEPGYGDNGRGCQVAEVWLRPVPEPNHINRKTE